MALNWNNWGYNKSNCVSKPRNKGIENIKFSKFGQVINFGTYFKMLDGRPQFAFNSQPVAPSLPPSLPKFEQFCTSKKISKTSIEPLRLVTCILSRLKKNLI